jgi:putative tryptophan/tyrosine transport system substrate-binding protein
LAGNAEQLPEAATGLVRRNVDLILASGAAAVLPAREAARGVPVIFVAGIDPIATGLAVGGLAQPDVNVTGLTTVADTVHLRRHVYCDLGE